MDLQDLPNIFYLKFFLRIEWWQWQNAFSNWEAERSNFKELANMSVIASGGEEEGGGGRGGGGRREGGKGGNMPCFASALPLPF